MKMYGGFLVTSLSVRT